MMNNNEVWLIILTWLLDNATNEKFKSDLQVMIQKLNNKKHVEETDDPHYVSIVMGYNNLFPFSILEYRKMAETLRGENV